jgi:hypothetical protein
MEVTAPDEKNRANDAGKERSRWPTTTVAMHQWRGLPIVWLDISGCTRIGMRAFACSTAPIVLQRCKKKGKLAEIK